MSRALLGLVSLLSSAASGTEAAMPAGNASAVPTATAPHAEVHLLQSVRKQLVHAPLLRGQFVQAKTVKGFKKPLTSRGDFTVVRNEGLLWDTREPFSSRLTLTRDSLSAAAGTEATHSAGGGYQLDARREPALAAVNALLLGLFSADTALLAQRFRVEGERVSSGTWRLKLTPTDVAISRLFRKIELEGDRFIRQIGLEGTNGDVTQLQFHGFAETPPLHAEESKRLGR